MEIYREPKNHNNCIFLCECFSVLSRVYPLAWGRETHNTYTLILLLINKDNLVFEYLLPVIYSTLVSKKDTAEHQWYTEFTQFWLLSKFSH